jgi:hypothetical protein
MTKVIDKDQLVAWINANQRDEVIPTPVPAPAPAPSPTPTPAPAPLPQPSGVWGSKTNPFKINKPGGGYNIYIPENTLDGSISIPRGSKIYYEIDPVLIGGDAFKVGAVFYSGACTVCKLTQDKVTGAYSSEDCRGYTGLLDIVHDGQPYKLADKKFLYVIVGSPDGDATGKIWAVIPFVP